MNRPPVLHPLHSNTALRVPRGFCSQPRRASHRCMTPNLNCLLLMIASVTTTCNQAKCRSPHPTAHRPIHHLPAHLSALSRAPATPVNADKTPPKVSAVTDCRMHALARTEHMIVPIYKYIYLYIVIYESTNGTDMAMGQINLMLSSKGNAIADSCIVACKCNSIY